MEINEIDDARPNVPLGTGWIIEATFNTLAFIIHRSITPFDKLRAVQDSKKYRFSLMSQLQTLVTFDS